MGPPRPQIGFIIFVCITAATMHLKPAPLVSPGAPQPPQPTQNAAAGAAAAAAAAEASQQAQHALPSVSCCASGTPLVAAGREPPCNGWVRRPWCG